jgi:hypothetical protein
MAATSLNPEDQPAQKGKSDRIVWIGLTVALLALLTWNYTTFAGGLWSADTDSPDCIKVQAIVTDIHASGGNSRKASQETYSISYDYTVDGKTYDNKEKVDYNVYHRTRLGGEVEICYMKDHPGRAAVIGNDTSGDTAFYVVLADIGALIAIVLLIRDWMRRRRKAV